ncbi:GH32 C-terminal domain-containing protein [Psychrosphaera sp. 1_MG-2023]|uniref:GH32 C-terminal domain-containing protein n=1 Tax=Psychrosphaera sp. 1_MG-2023 TaxID=3062643 RepID=UPI0026E3ACE4|nr:GH32 C-terminal domain-containing protein [Psychrosphaera sp. 1_MG-2023]MDO6720775.1 GH32 C-terminal domain-containing protein [Psychrosphaera sp. 1_MG-2023]
MMTTTLRFFANLLALHAFLAVIFFSERALANSVLLTENFDNLAKSNVKLFTQFEQPDSVAGVTGRAWRTDGFSSWGEASVSLQGVNSFTFSTWVALESYPSDLEVTADKLTPSAIVNQRIGDLGFEVYLDTFGRWGLWLATSKGPVNIKATEPFPLYQWNHLAFSLNDKTKTVSLYLNDTLLGKAQMPSFGQFTPANTPLLLAKSHQEVELLNFTINRINGAFDNILLTTEVFSLEKITQMYLTADLSVVDAENALSVPSSRFALDHLRPRYHPMPPANWTNEPHGLVRKNELWHMFYQRTPNGPFKTQMHWGHMVSDDLVTWTDYPDALRPEINQAGFGYDMKGIWSGDVVVDGEQAYAFYTSVNHSDRLTSANPGVSVAMSLDPNLIEWQKVGPIINTQHVEDFRDPYLWQENGNWHMLIGAAYKNYGGLDYYIADKLGPNVKWQHQSNFSSLPYQTMDIGSIIWEMPVFEALTEDVYVLVVNPIGGTIEKYGDPATRGVYWTGTWKNGQFQPHYTKPKMLDVIVGHLSPTVARGEDGAIRAIGIVDERRTAQAQENAGWTHTFSFPRRWFLSQNRLALGQAPAPELVQLRDKLQFNLQKVLISPEPIFVSSELKAYELYIKGQALSDNSLKIDVLSSSDGTEQTSIVIDGETGKVTLDKSRSSLAGEDEGPQILTGHYSKQDFGTIESVRVFVDGSVVDVFINDAAAFSVRSYPSKRDSDLVKVSSTSTFSLENLKLWSFQPDVRKLSITGKNK